MSSLIPTEISPAIASAAFKSMAGHRLNSRSQWLKKQSIKSALAISQAIINKKKTRRLAARGRRRDQQEHSVINLTTNYHHNILERFVNDKRHADIEFVVGVDGSEQVIPAIKGLLSAASPVFDAMFTHASSDSKSSSLFQQEEKQGSIRITDADPDVFRALINYIYTGQLVIKCLDAALQMFYLANKYHLASLMNALAKSMSDQLTRYSGDCLLILKAAKLYVQPCLYDACLQLIDNHGQYFLNCAQFLDLDEDLVADIVSRDTLRVPSELDIFQAVEKWATARANDQTAENGEKSGTNINGTDAQRGGAATAAVQNPSNDMDQDHQAAKWPIKLPTSKLRSILEPKILRHVRFPLMSLDEFCGTVVPSGLLTLDECLKIYNHITYGQTGDDLPFKTKPRY